MRRSTRRGALFIIGTDTGVGKTIVTGLLGKFLLDRGCNAITQKWIQSGRGMYSDDVIVHLKFMGKKKKEIGPDIDDICSYTFRFPASPHLAARVEKKDINPDKIIASFKHLASKYDPVLVEGIGGALVPFNEKQLVIDIACRLDLPVLIVAGNKLGAINHTLLTIEAVRSRKMRLAGIIFNDLPCKTDKRILGDNPEIIKKITKEKTLGILPWSKNKALLNKKFIPIGNKIIRALKW